MTSPLETDLEQRCCEWAKATYGVLSTKLTTRGWPDRLFLIKGYVFFVEFKREGETPQDLQTFIHSELRLQGFAVEVVDNFELFTNTVAAHLAYRRLL